VVSQALLTPDDAPGAFLTIAEYRRPEDRAAVLALVRAHPPPAPPLVRRSFVGRVGVAWERSPAAAGPPPEEALA
jgi:hypothetical protein